MWGCVVILSLLFIYAGEEMCLCPRCVPVPGKATVGRYVGEEEPHRTERSVNLIAMAGRGAAMHPRLGLHAVPVDAHHAGAAGSTRAGEGCAWRPVEVWPSSWRLVEAQPSLWRPDPPRSGGGHCGKPPPTGARVKGRQCAQGKGSRRCNNPEILIKYQKYHLKFFSKNNPYLVNSN